MRPPSLILATAQVAATASPPPAMADKKTDAVIAKAFLGGKWAIAVTYTSACIIAATEDKAQTDAAARIGAG